MIETQIKKVNRTKTRLKQKWQTSTRPLHPRKKKHESGAQTSKLSQNHYAVNLQLMCLRADTCGEIQTEIRNRWKIIGFHERKSGHWCFLLPFSRWGLRCWVQEGPGQPRGPGDYRAALVPLHLQHGRTSDRKPHPQCLSTASYNLQQQVTLPPKIVKRRTTPGIMVTWVTWPETDQRQSGSQLFLSTVP